MRVQYYFPLVALALLGNRLLSLVCTHPLSIFILFAFLKISHSQLPGNLFEWSSHFGYPLVLGVGVRLFQ